MSGNLYDGQGADIIDGFKTKLIIGGETLSWGDSTTIQTAQGILEISGNGAYTYTNKTGVNVGNLTDDVIPYTIQGANGSTSTAELTIDITSSKAGVVVVGTSANDTFLTGSGADTVIFDLLDASGTVGGNTTLTGNDVWTDFNFEQGDTLDLRGLLKDSNVDNIGDYVRIVQQGDNAKVEVDLDGPGLLSGGFTGLVILNNTNVTLDDLIDKGQIIW